MRRTHLVPRATARKISSRSTCCARTSDAFGISSHYLYKRRTHDVAANWKLVIDAFLESYRAQLAVCADHRHLLRGRDHRGRHDRAVISVPPWGVRNILPRLTATTWAALRKAVTYTYQIFPNAVVIVSPDYINILVVMPQSVGSQPGRGFGMLIAEPPQTNAGGERTGRRAGTCLDGGTLLRRRDFHAAALQPQRGSSTARPAKGSDPGAPRERRHCRVPCPVSRRRSGWLRRWIMQISRPFGSFGRLLGRCWSTASSAFLNCRSCSQGLLRQPTRQFMSIVRRVPGHE